MSIVRHRWSMGVASTLLLALMGCSGKPAVDTSTSEAKVTGTVKVHGKPMKGGEIHFDPSNYQRKSAAPTTATVKQDGTFELTTLVGQNTVTITGPDVTKEPKLGYTTQTVDVKSNDNSVDLDFPPPK